MFERFRVASVTVLGVLLCLFTLWEVNFPRLQPQSALAVFVMLGMVLCFLVYPIHPRFKGNMPLRMTDVLLALATIVCCSYVIIQTEPALQQYWLGGELDDTARSLGNRAGDENRYDYWIGVVGVLLVLEATRRSIGWIVPGLAVAFMAHSYYCYGSVTYGWTQLPGWLLPHAGQNLKDITSTAFLQTLGVFGPAANVMFQYVFLFVVFGAFLEMSGATQFIIDFAEKVFGKSPGGPAKVSVLGSGLMGSLSGSAVANAVTTGSFTIPMMRNAGFQPHIAGGITAAAASGGALVPPVMGAGAYMMLELVKPQVTFLQIVQAALIPAVLYYLSIFMIVHFYSHRVGAEASAPPADANRSLWQFEAIVFFGALGVLITLLLLGFSAFRAVTGSLVVILLLSTIRPSLPLARQPRVVALVGFAVATILGWFVMVDLPAEPTGRQVFDGLLAASIVGTFGLLLFGLAHPAWRPSIADALRKSAMNGIALVAASACVGIIIGIVQQTGIASDLSSEIKKVVESNLLLALVGIMGCSIFLGMGVPSVVCYLLMATLMSSLLSELGVIPLAAHLFIFYFGMMSMVTPPVALAAYASASIAEAPIMPTAMAAFRFSLVGFTLPFMFVYRPELLLMSNKPEIEVSLARPKEVSIGQPVPVSIAITRFGQSLGDAPLRLTSTGDEAEPQEFAADTYGNARVEVAPGTYDIDYLRDDGVARHLGTITFDPAKSPEAAAPGAKEASGDPRLVYVDERLSILDVLIGTGAAVVGIIALAAGIAGYLFTEIRVPVRIGMLIAAALLLSPDLRIGGQEIGPLTNIAGCGLFFITGVINFLRPRDRQDSAASSETGAGPETPSSDADHSEK